MGPRPRAVALLAASVLCLPAALAAWGPPAPPPEDQLEAYQALRPKSILEQQPYRTTTKARVLVAGSPGQASLVDLAPTTHVWFLLDLAVGGATTRWHLENPRGVHAPLQLQPDGTLTVDGQPCPLWDELAPARASGATYAPLCGGLLFLRNPTDGHKTKLEWTADFLRDHVWGGERITTWVKEATVDRAVPDALLLGATAETPLPAGGPPTPSLAPDAVGRTVPKGELGLPLEGSAGELVPVGAWLPVQGVRGAYASVLAPGLVAEPTPEAALLLNPLDAVDQASPVYSIAFDLARFDLGYEVGTDHPRLDWSGRALPTAVDPTLPGPDGIADMAPLVRTGLVDPAWTPGVAAVFVGGFKRGHGAFRTGPLSTANRASHYGFVQHGVELSHLQPDLSTLVVGIDGRVDLRLWTAQDEGSIWALRHARQNGVPIVLRDAATGTLLPGSLVRSWAPGNWSGSADGQLRSIRSGVCLVEDQGRRFLVYSYFAAATPSAMARVYLSMGCEHAMLLDMNALEHTYLAVVEGGRFHHLVTGMEVLDLDRKGARWPRFAGYADNRDFFYVLRREEP